MILVDTSAWIDGFRGGICKNILNRLIDLGEICINEVVLAELLPSIRHREETHLESLLFQLPRLRMWIDWNELVIMQTENLRHGINKVGLPDLMIVQNAIQNNVTLLSFDKHFSLMKQIFKFDLYHDGSEDGLISIK